jgi:hypothetical protein
MDDSPDKPKTGSTSDPPPARDTDPNSVERDAKSPNGEPAVLPSGGAARGRSPLFGN